MPSEPVTVVITRTAKAGKVSEFEQWMEGIIHAAMKFQGFAGINVIRPQDPSNPEYVIIFHFDTSENLTRWESSDIRRHWAERGQALIEGESTIERRTGMEFWFTPRSAGQPTPVRYKMAIVLVAVISLLLVTLMPLIQLATEDLHPALSLVMGVAIMVVLMTYVVMPTLTRILRPWIHRKGVF